MLAANPFYASFASADFFGKCIFLALFVLSVGSWILLIYKVWLVHWARRRSIDFLKSHQTQTKHPLTWTVPPATGDAPNCFAELYALIKKQSVEVLNKNHDASQSEGPVALSHSDVELVEALASTGITRQTQELEKNLFILATTYSLAPFLGLLGTVWGILVTFSQLQHQTAGSSNQVMMSGLSMALATTVLGLLVAIPALIGYSYLKNYVRDFAIEMESFATDLLASIELHYRKVDTV